MLNFYYMTLYKRKWTLIQTILVHSNPLDLECYFYIGTQPNQSKHEDNLMLICYNNNLISEQEFCSALCLQQTF